MTLYLKLGAAAVAVGAVLAVATLHLGVGSSARMATNPSAQVSTASSTPARSAAAAVSKPASSSPPAPTAVFDSEIYGLTIKYPETWEPAAAITPWTMAAGEYQEPMGDFIVDPTHEFLWLKLASTRIGDAPFDDWAASVFAGHGCPGFARSVTIDGVAGLIDDSCHTALVASGGRGYLIGAHLCPCELGSLSQWGAWFSDVLTTVQLEPRKAVDRT